MSDAKHKALHAKAQGEVSNDLLKRKMADHKLHEAVESGKVKGIYSKRMVASKKRITDPKSWFNMK